jgi:hypothetical protein
VLDGFARIALGIALLFVGVSWWLNPSEHE